MAITRLSATNFKCFNSLDVSLGRFNVLIGTNAVGKSNFVQIFKFLRDLVQYGADNAISMQGGPEYLANISLGTSQPLSLSITSDREYRFVRGRKNLIGFKIRETVYTLVLHLKKGKLAFDIASDKVAVVCDVFTMGPRNRDTIEEKEKIGEARIQIANLQGKLSVQTDLPQTAGLTEDDIIPKFAVEERRPPNTALLQQHFYFLPFPAPWVFSDIAIYDFDPKLPKKAVPITGKCELEEDGSNLAIILKNLIDNKADKRKFSNLVKDLLPFVDDLEVEKFADKSLLFKLREVYARGEYLPASLISDGTINISALLIALYFERKEVTVIEEPERNIHPHLISKIVQMMKDASKRKQIIVTTHNPEMVKYAGLENILLITRDSKTGWSSIRRPQEREAVRKFLENEIGVDELYVRNLLSV